nr:surface antigen protein [uncultured bacterium]
MDTKYLDSKVRKSMNQGALLKINRSIIIRAVLLILLTANLAILSGKIQADTGSCGGVTITLPFNDVMSSPFFCQIAAAYYSGLTNGTTATTYSPTQEVTREQMAAFISRTMDQSLKRSSRKAVTEKWWTPQTANNLTLTDVGTDPTSVTFDGTDLWVTNMGSDSVMRIRPSDGKVLDTWTGATSAFGSVAAMGRIFIVGRTNPGTLYMIDPTQPAGPVTTLSASLGAFPFAVAFDGSRIWTANLFGSSVSIVSLNPTTVTTVSLSPIAPIGMLYDGSNIWVTGSQGLHKLNSNGTIAQTIPVGIDTRNPVFDGTNIWVPNTSSPSITVVRVKDALGNPLTTPFVLATLTGNGLNGPFTAAFDGERICVTNVSAGTVSLWKAADLLPLGSFPTGANPSAACSDGLNFWFTIESTNKLVRF